MNTAMNEQTEQTIFEDLTDLEKSLAQDRNGDKARAMIVYFEQVERDSLEMQKTVQADVERMLAGQLLEAFRAAQRVIRHVWEALHGTPLHA